MKFSVIIPCHNAGPYIGDALRSVAAQTVPAHEIIVIDDGSTDDSLQQVRASGVEVRLLESSWRNGAGTRNVGIEAATGDWIAFLDADDLWYPEHLERAVDLLEASGDIAFHAHADRLYEDGRWLKRPNPWPPTEPTNGLKDIQLLEFFWHYMVFNTSTVVMRRDVLIERGMFDPTCIRRHDMDMWLRVTKGRTWAYDPVPSAVYRADTPGSISRISQPSSDRWYLRMLLRNAADYEEPVMQALIAHGARRVMNTAFTEGTAEDRAKGRGLAWSHLNRKLKAMYRVAELCPPAFGLANRWRRRWVQRRAGRGASS